MKRIWWIAIVVSLSGCGALSAQMAAQGNACAARGGVLTGMGCEGGGPAFAASPGRVDTAPAADRYGQPNYDAQGQYVGGHGAGLLVDRPAGEVMQQPTPMPANVVCTKNADGTAGNCVSQ